ncbi:MAG: hypothetical protein ACLSG5_18175, partial [Oscillospiraceae bacterium]
GIWAAVKYPLSDTHAQAAAILKYATYGYPLDKRCGDTNADGAVDAHDALPILNYVVGNVKLLPAVGFRQ